MNGRKSHERKYEERRKYRKNKKKRRNINNGKR